MHSHASIRASNPLSPALVGSTVLFRAAMVTQDQMRVRELTLPHELIDAFGGLLLMKDLAASLDATFAPEFFPESSGEVAGCEWHHYWLETPGRRDIEAASDVTLAQSAMAELLRAFGPDVLRTVSVAVSVDDLNQVAELGPWGNSFGLVNMPRDQAQKLVDGPKESWRQELADRSARSLAALARRPALRDKAGTADVLFSSLGAVDRFPWVPGLDPRSFIMIPTPSVQGMATVVLWAKGPYQALAITGKADHPIVMGRKRLAKAWRGLFK